jgi:hypothetical protein
MPGALAPNLTELSVPVATSAPVLLSLFRAVVNHLLSSYFFVWRLINRRLPSIPPLCSRDLQSSVGRRPQT